MVKESKDKIAAQGLQGARSLVGRHHPSSLEFSPLTLFPLFLFPLLFTNWGHFATLRVAS